MLKNNGRKIKSWAETLMYITIIVGALAILIGFVLTLQQNELANKLAYGLAWLICAIIAFSFLIILCRLMYGFGELVEKTSEIANIMRTHEERYWKEKDEKDEEDQQKKQ